MADIPLWAQNLERWLIQRGMTPEELADAADVNLKSLYGYLKGEVENPRGDTLERLASALGTTEIELRFQSAPPSELSVAINNAVASNGLEGSIADNIRLARERKGLSQSELARHLGVQRQAVFKWEKGLSVPGRKLVPVLCELLGLHPSELDPFVAPDKTQHHDGDCTSDKLTELRFALLRIRTVLGLSPLHDVVESVRLLYEEGREAFEKQRGPRYPHR